MNKKILLIATGGTIASDETEHGLAPALSGENLAAQIEGLPRDCQLDVVQVMNIDSTNMTPEGWLHIQQAIAEHYHSYDGFVVLHGTDTLHYTAAALSYLIQNSPKPIVITGSQKPMVHPYTDGKINLYQSILYALDEHSHDVCIVFNGRVIAGTRGRKQKTRSFDGFSSINHPLLAQFQDDTLIRLLPPAQPEGSLKMYSSLAGSILSFRLVPGMNPRFIPMLKEHCDGLILEAFGLGGIPNYDSSFQDAIFDWVDSGRFLVLTTQVPEEGSDFSVYEVGHTYHNHDRILNGGTMTPEAAAAKLMWILGQTRDAEEVRELFCQRINSDC